MSVSREYKQFLEEAFAPFGPVSVRSMFGGGGVFHEGLMIGLVSGETLYLKADAQTIPDFEAEACEPFVFRPRSGKSAAMSYWRAPEYILDDPEQLAVWAEKARQAARRSRAKTGGRRKRR